MRNEVYYELQKELESNAVQLFPSKKKVAPVAGRVNILRMGTTNLIVTPDLKLGGILIGGH